MIEKRTWSTTVKGGPDLLSKIQAGEKMSTSLKGIWCVLAKDGEGSDGGTGTQKVENLGSRKRRRGPPRWWGARDRKRKKRRKKNILKKK